MTTRKRSPNKRRHSTFTTPAEKNRIEGSQMNVIQIELMLSYTLRKV